MSDDPTLAAILAAELEQAFDAELDGLHALALQYYDGDPGSVPPGWSDLVSTDVRDAIESTVAELMGSINFDEPLAIFSPNSESDLQRSELETWAVHQQIMGSNRGATAIEQAVRDALLQRFAVIKAYVREQETTESREFENLDPAALATLMMDDTDDHQTSIGTMEQNKDGSINASVSITDKVRRLEISSVAPENFRWSSDVLGPWLDEARFFAERCWYTRAQLRELGASGWQDVPTGSQPDAATTRRHPDNPGAITASRHDDENIECWWCYLRNNTKGGYDQHLFVSPSHVMLSSHVEFHPFACGVAIVRPHRFDGVSLFDRIGPTQKAQTYLLRQLATQARLTNQTRLVVRDRTVNPDDIGSERLNPVIRSTGVPAECVLPIPVQDVTTQLLATMQWIDKKRRESGGASIDMTSPELQIAGQSAHAAEREYSFRELGATAMLRTLGDTLIRSLYLLVHATLKLEMKSPVMVRKGAKFLNSDPQHWPRRTDVAVDIGQPLGVRSRRISALMQTIAMQVQTLQGGGGGLLVTLPGIYAAQVDLAKLAGLRDAGRYWTDPDSPQAQQAAQGQAQQAQAAQQQSMALQQQVIDSTKQIEQLKADTEILKERMQSATTMAQEHMRTQAKYFEEILAATKDKAELEQAAIQATQAAQANAAVNGAVQ